jgi:hypothetical protein
MKQKKLALIVILTLIVSMLVSLQIVGFVNLAAQTDSVVTIRPDGSIEGTSQIQRQGNTTETVEDYWSTKTPLPQTAGGLRAAVVNGKIHVIGGSVHYVYDPVTGNWVAKSCTEGYFGIAVCQNKIYTIGGGLWDSDIGWITSNKTEVYDPITDSWETKNAMPTSRMSLSANEVDGKIYLIGGQTGGPSSIVGLNEVYDVANDSWTIKEPIHYPVDSYASAVADDKIYVIGGFEGLYHGVPVGYTQIYDPLTDSWSLGASLPEIVRSAAAGATTGISGKENYVVGGDRYGCLNYTQIYNIDNDMMLGAQMRPLGVHYQSHFNDVVCNWALLCPMTFHDNIEQYLPFDTDPLSSVSSVDGMNQHF